MRAFWIVLVGCLAIVGLLNYRFDVTASRADYRPLMPIPPGHFVMGDFINERVLKATLLDTAPTVDLVILGSSRSLALGTPHFEGRTVLNLAVTSGTADDYQYFLGKLAARQPRTVLVELSPWTFNATCDRLDNHRRYRDISPGLRARFDAFTSLLTSSHLKGTAFFIFHHGSKGAVLPEAGNEALVGYSADGRRHYHQSELAVTLETVRDRAAKYPLTDGWQLKCGVQTAKVAAFCAASGALRHSGTTVLAYLPPWNPESVAGLHRQSPPIEVADLNADVAEAVRRCGVAVVDLSSACTAGEFFDHYHALPSCFRHAATSLQRAPRESSPPARGSAAP